MIKILLLTDFSSGYGRSLLEGVVRYAREAGPWVFYRMPLYYRELHGDEGVVRWAEEWGADAIIAQLTDVDLNVLNRLDIPIIVQNYKERCHGLSNLTGDYYGTGVMAAEFFIRKGYKAFAYYGFTDTVWMRERGEGFRDAVSEKGYPVYTFDDGRQLSDGQWNFDAERVSRWLLDLPKPIALFACDDYYALQITEVCKMYNIDIPGDIAVLGVDNDNLLCNISDPALSSIELDVENGGYEVGKLLHQFIEKKITAPADVIIKPVRIVSRGSTERFAVSDKYIGQVLAYIDENYCNPLSVDDLIRIIPYSRRVLEKKFKSETGMSVYQYIQQQRIEKFAALLITTDLPLTEAAAGAGFPDYKNVSRIFVKMKEMTPLQYRKRFTIR
ncbi:DNA-binding transcriptional regulator [Parabacteroides acidifaciens]|uniref:DNA-binding transcriptional regulator n=1 Tax=Parabacteroides acidifaciens TaxID=2290935 RepID=A0A3D8H958_9BACT|nr:MULTISPECIES: DNA-binding transcriptional regulator [Parabacteroides]MBC8603735.1 DNA-binding transcriptional regulator [Parabacteroides acidifaciens]RDU47525.1 helix-turn-helix domain-containing protein [Parabacteroides acidifaciens]RHO66581.1 helix-turn-helix domain-containing protein [Parabacteroides sp. AF48-14]RHR51267.1 helix-turn-helix domain-containing protein [Parabacteroides sp. AF17-28]